MKAIRTGDVLMAMEFTGTEFETIILEIKEDRILVYYDHKIGIIERWDTVGVSRIIAYVEIMDKIGMIFRV